MKKIITIFTLFLFLFACDKNNQETIEKDIKYLGQMTKGALVLDIQFFIENFSNNSITSYYLYTKYNQPIELAGGIVDSKLTLAEKNTDKQALFIFNNFDINDEKLFGVWINPNDNTDVYNVVLTKYNPEIQSEIHQENLVINEKPELDAGGLRDYVCRINQSYHPDVVDFIVELQNIYKKNNEEEIANALGNILKGGFGSGFIYIDKKGNNYVITNYHVVEQANNLSITFERKDGSIKRYNNLKILYVDENADLAILCFPQGQRPFSDTLQISQQVINEGDKVYSAGFPGLNHEPVWQFGEGIVSNKSVNIQPNTTTIENNIQRFIQHTATVDPGNSGGPLLIANNNKPTGFSIVGINTKKATDRQAANFAIPISTLDLFIKNALEDNNKADKDNLNKRIDIFISKLKSINPAYPIISDFLTTDFAAQDIKYSFTSTFDEDVEKIIEMADSGMIKFLRYISAWMIEKMFDLKQRGNEITLLSLNKNGDIYNCNLLINNNRFIIEWKKEHGVWRINNCEKM